jgi:hypothetical protein
LEKRSGQRPLLSQTPTGSSSGSLSSQPQRQQKATATEKPAPTLASSAGTAAALTPPDETLPLIQGQGRKRRPPPTAAPQPAMSPPAPIAPVALPQAPLSTPSSPNKRRRASSRSVPVPVPIAAASEVSFLPQPASPVLLQQQQQQQQQQALATALSGALPFLEEVVEAIKARAAPRWRELALDLFFREHADEELDLQVKISENVLSNETKAMVFCKMPDRVRQHWVGKFREMHQMNKSTANSSGPAAATT